MVARDAKEYPKTIPSEIQGGRPLHFLRVLSWVPLLEYGTTKYVDNRSFVMPACTAGGAAAATRLASGLRARVARAPAFRALAVRAHRVL